MTFADHFSSVAKDYAAYRPHYPLELAAALADRSPNAAREQAWDVGCGNGQLSVDLAVHFAHVIATDPAAAQIREAQVHPKVEYRVAPAESSKLPDASVALVVAAQAAHWFDLPMFIAETERVAKHGALVALIAYGFNTIEGGDRVNEIVSHYYHHVVGAYWPPERAHIENGYRDLVLPWPAVKAPPLVMTARWSRDELLGYLSTWSATSKAINALGPALFETLTTQLEAIWPANDVRSVHWPLTIKLARR